MAWHDVSGPTWWDSDQYYAGLVGTPVYVWDGTKWDGSAYTGAAQVPLLRPTPTMFALLAVAAAVRITVMPADTFCCGDMSVPWSDTIYGVVDIQDTMAGMPTTTTCFANGVANTLVSANDPTLLANGYLFAFYQAGVNVPQFSGHAIAFNITKIEYSDGIGPGNFWTDFAGCTET